MSDHSPFEVRLQRAIDLTTEMSPMAMIVILRQDVVDALSLIAALKQSHEDKAEVIAKLVSESAVSGRTA